MNACCQTCEMFSSEPPKGLMPGVTESHRECLLKTLSNSKKWRGPSDWCDRYTPNNE